MDEDFDFDFDDLEEGESGDWLGDTDFSSVTGWRDSGLSWEDYNAQVRRERSSGGDW